MARKLKVYGGCTILGNGKQVRAVVAVHNQQEVANLTGITLSHLRSYWCETGNKEEVELALSKPLTVFISDGVACRVYKQMED